MIPTREQILSADVEQLNTWCAELIMGYTLHYEQIGLNRIAG